MNNARVGHGMSALLLGVALLGLQGASAWGLAAMPDPEEGYGQDPKVLADTANMPQTTENFDQDFRDQVKQRKLLQQNKAWNFQSEVKKEKKDAAAAREALLAFRAQPLSPAPAAMQPAALSTRRDTAFASLSLETCAIFGVVLVLLVGSYFAMRHTRGESEVLKDIKQQSEKRKTQRLERQDASKRRSKPVDLSDTGQG